MPLTDGFFLKKSPAEIITQVASTTLAVISLWSQDELIRTGWLQVDKHGQVYINPIIDILYSMTSAGVWIARTDASGQVKVIDYNSGTNTTYLKQALNPTVGDSTSSSAESAYRHHRIKQVSLTEAGGAIAATAIVTGIGTYKAHCIIKKIWAPAGTTDPANTWSITSEAGGAITGPSTFGMNLTAERNHWVDAGAAGVSGSGILVYNTTADKDILLSAADLAAVGIAYLVEIEYWYEA